MPQWMTELEDLIKGMGKPSPKKANDDNDDDEDDGYDDEEDGGGDGDMEKSMYGDKGCYPPADNGDDDDQPSGAAVRDPDKIENKTRNLGSKKLKKPKGVNAGDGGYMGKGLRDVVGEDNAEVIDGAPVLSAIADAMDQIAHNLAKSFRRINRRLDEVDAAQALIGTAVTKALQGNSRILKSLQAEVEAVGSQPAGRKGVVKSVDRNFEGNSKAPTQPSRMEIMQKSLKALSEGRITPVQSASVDSYMNRGAPLPSDLLAKIMGG